MTERRNYMREKAKDLVYLNTENYISIDSILTFYWKIIIIPLIMISFGVASISTIGVNWKSLFPLISIGVWSLLYWMFVLILRSGKIKKTFELRFLVNGTLGIFVSSLFYLLITSVNLVADNQLFGFDFSLWILLFYLLFSGFYIGAIVFGVHKGIFRRIKEKSQTPIALAISAFFSALIPSAGAMGMFASRILRENASKSVQYVIEMGAFVLLMFLTALAHINFVQYHYCKKYKILCDENGNSTSPKLEYKVKDKNRSKSKDLNRADTSVNFPSKKKTNLTIKILIGIISVPVAFIIVVFLVFFIKGFIRGIT